MERSKSERSKGAQGKGLEAQEIAEVGSHLMAAKHKVLAADAMYVLAVHSGARWK